MKTTDLNKYIGMRCNIKGLTVLRTNISLDDNLKNPRTFIIIGHDKGKMIITDRNGGNHHWKVLLSNLKNLG